MGHILGSKVTNDGKIILSVCLEHEEALQLQGHIDDIHVFSGRIANIKTNVAMRGQNAATKYFLIPKDMRSNIRYSSEANCQKLETKNKLMFIYVIDKYKL